MDTFGPTAVREESLAIRIAAVVALAIGLLFMLGTAADARAAKPEAEVTLGKVSQKALVAKGKIGADVKASDGPIRLVVRALQGKDEKRIAPRETLKGKKGSVTFELNKRGNSTVQSCVETEIELGAKVKGKHGWHLAGKDKSEMKRDPARCEGEAPVGVNVADADRCDPIAAPDAGECLFPYPNDFYTEPDPDTDTGLRLALDPEATPVNAAGTHINPAEINTSDGFSPGAAVVTRVPGMDSPAAFAQTDPVPITNMGEFKKPDAPIVVIDAATGNRQMIWTELDSNASTPGDTDLLIHWGKNLEDGHRYIVAMRGMKTAAGAEIPAPEGFRLYRDKIPTAYPALEQRRDHMNEIFKRLQDSGIQRKSLYTVSYTHLTLPTILRV